MGPTICKWRFLELLLYILRINSAECTKTYEYNTNMCVLPKKKVVGLKAKGLVYTNKSSPSMNTTIHISNFIIY